MKMWWNYRLRHKNDIMILAGKLQQEVQCRDQRGEENVKLAGPVDCDWG